MEYREMLTTPVLGRKVLLDDLHAFVDRCARFGVQELQVLFGFAWGNEHGGWESIVSSPSGILEQVQQAEREGAGALGSDDLWITGDGGAWRLQYCHEGDIHFGYEEPSAVVEEHLAEWRRKGWIPGEPDGA